MNVEFYVNAMDGSICNKTIFSFPENTTEEKIKNEYEKWLKNNLYYGYKSLSDDSVIKDPLDAFETNELVDELAKRKEVVHYNVHPYQEFNLNVSGPSKILLIND